MTKVELVKARTFELDPKKFYLVVIDRKAITIEDAENLFKGLPSNQGIVLMVNGDPNDVIKIIEQPIATDE